MSCIEAPYNIRTTAAFNRYYELNGGNVIDTTHTPNVDIDYDKWKQCITDDINKNNIDMNTLNTQAVNWSNDHDMDDTATELNNYSMTLYDADLKYTFSKIFFFIILAIVYIFFFKVNGIITPIIALFVFIKQKIMVDLPLAAEKVVKKMPNVAEKVLPENIPKVPEKSIKNMSNITKIKK